MVCAPWWRGFSPLLAVRSDPSVAFSTCLRMKSTHWSQPPQVAFALCSGSEYLLEDFSLQIPRHCSHLGESTVGYPLQSGLPTNLASLWSTNPAAHEKLMADYRDGRAAGRQPATELQAAQRAMQVSPRFGHPYFWGGYLLAEGGRPAVCCFCLGEPAAAIGAL